MNIGMLWFDNDPKTGLSAKIERAVDHYRQKYGRDPNLCLIHPSMVDQGPQENFKIPVRPYRSVLPGHFWIGIEDKH
jgi:hypothetical protein